jgi:transposase
MHIDDQTFTSNGKTYRRVLLRNSYRKDGKTCHDTIANLSSCSPPEIAAIKYALAHKHQLQTRVNIPPPALKTRQGLSVGAVWLLHQVAKRLGVDKALGPTPEAKRCLWLVIAALIGAVSRLSATRLAQRHAAGDILGLDDFNEDDLYAALDWLADHQDKIEARLFAHRYGRTAPSIYLYEVTSSYLEGEHNAFGAYGYNRDRKKGKKQIVVGLLTDDDGRPLSCEVFPGNTQDPQTFKRQIDKVRTKFGIEKVTFVGDRGMIKSAQIRDLDEANFHYITAVTKPPIEGLLKNDVLQLELFEDPVCEVEDNGVRYVVRRNPLRAAEIRQTRSAKRRQVATLCAQKNAYLQAHPKARVATAVRALEARAKKLKIADWMTVASADRQVSLQVDDEARREQENLDGCYALKTDLPKDAASRQTVHDRYCALEEVEWGFRTMKTTVLHLRGIFVRKAERTRAHVFIIMLAYLLAYELRRLWSTLDITISDGLDELSSLCATEVILEGVGIQTIPEPRPLGQRLLQAAKVMLPDAIPHRGAIASTRKSLVEDRRTN